MKHGPIQKEQYENMNALARGIDAIINGEGPQKQWGFGLVIFPFGEKPDGRMNYISNGKREDMIVALKEFIAKVEGNYHEHKGTQ